MLAYAYLPYIIGRMPPWLPDAMLLVGCLILLGLGVALCNVADDAAEEDDDDDDWPTGHNEAYA